MFNKGDLARSLAVLLCSYLEGELEGLRPDFSKSF